MVLPQAWSLVHFFLYAQDARWQKQFLSFLDRLNRGASWESAFQQVFGTSEYTEIQDDVFVVEIRDTGVGISEPDLAKVFLKYQQVGEDAEERPKGTGLGLPISKQIIEHHGGEIGARSVQGEGSTFFFTLPLSRERP